MADRIYGLRAMRRAVRQSNQVQIIPNLGLTLLYSLHFPADRVLIGACRVVSIGAEEGR